MDLLNSKHDTPEYTLGLIEVYKQHLDFINKLEETRFVEVTEEEVQKLCSQMRGELLATYFIAFQVRTKFPQPQQPK